MMYVYTTYVEVKAQFSKFRGFLSQLCPAKANLLISSLSYSYTSAIITSSTALVRDHTMVCLNSVYFSSRMVKEVELQIVSVAQKISLHIINFMY